MDNHKKSVHLASLYGIEIYYRVEIRAQKPTLVFSFRDKSGRISYEAPPIQCGKYADAANGLLGKEGVRLEIALPREILIKFCNAYCGMQPMGKRAFPAEIMQAHTERRHLPLPFGFLLLADYTFLVNGSGRKGTLSRTTLEDRKRAIQRLFSKVGTKPWTDVDPQQCRSWLYRLSEHEQRSTVRLLQSVFRLQLAAGCMDRDPWSEFVILEREKQQNSKKLRETQLERQNLSDSQCAAILQTAAEHIQNGQVNQVELAALLMMLFSVSAAELCALRWADIEQLEDFPGRRVVHITHHVYREKKNYIRKPIADKYRKRDLPMPRLLGKYCHCLCRRTDEKESLPDQPVFSGGNRARHESPVQLEMEIDSFVAPFRPTAITNDDGRSLSGVALLRNTAAGILHHIRLEDEEIRRLEGKCPQLVSARSYMDFAAPVELNKIGKLYDQWIRSLGVCTPPREAKGSYCSHCPNAKAGLRLHFDLREIDPTQIPSEGIILQISADSGFSGEYRYRH